MKGNKRGQDGTQMKGATWGVGKEQKNALNRETFKSRSADDNQCVYKCLRIEETLNVAWSLVSSGFLQTADLASL